MNSKGIKTKIANKQTNVGERLIEKSGPLSCNASHLDVTFG